MGIEQLKLINDILKKCNPNDFNGINEIMLEQFIAANVNTDKLFML